MGVSLRDRAGVQGRYVGEADGWQVELRVDTADGCRVSGDVLDLEDVTGGRAASFTTLQPVTSVDGEWPVAWVDGGSATSTGRLSLSVLRPEDAQPRLEVALAVDDPLGAIPGGTKLGVPVRRVGRGLRRLGLEVETEAGVREPASVAVDGADVSYVTCFERAGFEVQAPAGARSTVEARPGGWSTSDVFSELHDVMAATAQSSLDEPTWTLHLLLLSRTSRDALLGVMFDAVGALPRQGAAVFAEEIRRNYSGADADRRIVQTIVHELGHGLNLTHRFGRDVRRADSTSFMTYDWLYRGGGRIEEYWKRFDYRFDDDELAFLRHAPRHEIIPGGAPFGSVRYWEAGTAVAAEVPRVRTGLRLWLTPPPAGTTFESGRPVFLQVSLQNEGTAPVELPRTVLDLKAGHLDVAIRRLGDGTTAPFVPIVRRCYDAASVAGLRLRPGESLHTNLNLSLGSAGFPFAEPGRYEILPSVGLPAVDCAGDLVEAVVEGDPVTVTILPPGAGAAEREEVDHLLRLRAGTLFALGGARVLADEQGALEDLAAQRDERRARLGDDPSADGVSAAIHRAAGIEAARHGDPEAALAHLRRALGGSAAAQFDPHTAEQTRRLAADLRRTVDGAAPRSATVTVDLAYQALSRPDAGYPAEEGAGPPAAGTPPRGRFRRAGVLLSGPAGATSVVVPAAQLPSGPLRIEATATVSAADGTVEVVSVDRVDVIGPEDPDAAPVLANLFLSRTVPAPPSPTFAPEVMTGPDPGESLWQFLSRRGAEPGIDAEVPGGAVGAPARPAGAAASALGASAVPPPAARTFLAHLDLLSPWYCKFVSWCQPGDAPEAPDDGPWPQEVPVDGPPCTGYTLLDDDGRPVTGSAGPGATNGRA